MVTYLANSKIMDAIYQTTDVAANYLYALQSRNTPNREFSPELGARKQRNWLSLDILGAHKVRCLVHASS